MERTKFDPLELERALVQSGGLPDLSDSPLGDLGPLEELFSEENTRKRALWRISLVRQFEPSILRGLSDDDLLFLAAHSAEGYSGKEHDGIVLDRNKIAQNAIRARIVLDLRIAYGAWRRTILLSLGTFLLGALTSLATLWLQAKFGGS